MRVTVTRSGGFAGLSRVWSVRIEEQPDEDQWRELIDRLPWDSDDPLSEEPDRFSYRVRCARRETVIPETMLTGPWRELVTRVQEANQTGGKNSDADAGGSPQGG